jgi:hypothetical protein
MAKSKFDAALGTFKPLPKAQAGAIIKAIAKAAKSYGKAPGAKKLLAGASKPATKTAKTAKTIGRIKKGVLSEKTKRDFLKGESKKKK